MIPKKALKTGPNLVGQYHQKVWLRVQRKHAQQRGASYQPGSYVGQGLALHVRHLMAVGSRLGDGWAFHARAG